MFGELRYSERGASAVELAISLTLLFYLLFGTIQFGIAYNRDQGISASAREGARVASVGASEADVGTRVRAAQSLFDPADVLVKIDYSIDDGATWPGNQVVCDDASGMNKCTAATAPDPCGVAGLGSLIRVGATVPGGSGKYAITIPLWGNADITYSAVGTFRCEQT